MNKAATLAAAKEVLGTLKGLAGDLLSAYLDTYFDSLNKTILFTPV